MSSTLSELKSEPKGSLTIVGTGIEAISHLALGTIAQLRLADIVFYHVPDPILVRYIRTLNPRTTDLFQFYGEGKLRRLTYIQMAEAMLREVRAGKRVVGAFSGHPGIFVMASRRAISIAREEAYDAKLTPAISSVDCMIADLRIDPGLHGLQIVKAGSVLRKRTKLQTDGHIALLQVGSVGDRTYSFGGFKKSKRHQLFAVLVAHYGTHHEAVYYEATSVPDGPPVIETRTLSRHMESDALEKIGSGILYLPPKGMRHSTVVHWHTTDMRKLEQTALSEMGDVRETWESPRRICSEEELSDVLRTFGVREHDVGRAGESTDVRPTESGLRHSLPRQPERVQPFGGPSLAQESFEWAEHKYYHRRPALFSPAEAADVIALSATTGAKRSELATYSGQRLRDSTPFWLVRSRATAWLFERVDRVVRDWNSDFRFELSEPSGAQLTLYETGQEYGWHMDVGSGAASRRKVSVVVGLNDPATYEGGATEFFYGASDSPSIRLNVGEALLFPAYVMHRACPVISGARWALIIWFCGRKPYC